MVIYLMSTVVTAIAVFLKGFQYKNVIGGHKKSIAGFAFLMAFLDVVSVSLVVKGGWTLGISAGAGAVIGMLVAIELHDRLYKPKGNT